MQHEECAGIDLLVMSLSGEDWSQVYTALNNIERLGIWPSAVLAMARVSRPTQEISECFHNSIWTVRGHRIREMVNNDNVLLDVLRILLPKYDGPSMVLYRGENIDRSEQGALGFAWTTRKDIALMFARGLNAEGKGGILLSVNAPTKAIIASPGRHSIFLDEHEYVVDPRHLQDIASIELFPRN